MQMHDITVINFSIGVVMRDRSAGIVDSPWHRNSIVCLSHRDRNAHTYSCMHARTPTYSLGNGHVNTEMFHDKAKNLAIDRSKPK